MTVVIALGVLEGDRHAGDRIAVLIANGPLAEQSDERMRGISMYALPLDEALTRANADPMVRAGRLEILGARWWTAEGAVRFGG